MCNLYASMIGQEALKQAFRFTRDLAGNLPPLPAIFPDGEAPIVRTGQDGERELVMARWGMPGAPVHGGRPVTNIRNPMSPHWRPWLGDAQRCLVPATSFCEYADTKPRKTPTWFALDESRPVFAFAGLWCTWHGTRGTKANPVEGEHRLFGFLTCAPNPEVAAVHPQAMPVVLVSPDAWEMWLTAPTRDALRLQRPLPEGWLRVVARGEREDPGGR